LAAIGPCAAQDALTPFKLGTFEHAAVRNPSSRLAAPGDMKDLIARYEVGLQDRIRPAAAGKDG
jgi:hypothetical protein